MARSVFSWISPIVVVAAALDVGCGGPAPQDVDVPTPTHRAPDAGRATHDVEPEDPAPDLDTGVVDAPDPTPPAPPPDVLPGAPISARDGEWTNIPFPEGYCRNGEKAHLMVHLNGASTKVAIYEEGGGACSNDASCTLMTFDAPPLFRAGLIGLLRDEDDMRVVVEVGSAAEILQAVAKAHAEIDLALLDLDLPDQHGVEIIAALADRVRVLVISAFDDSARPASRPSPIDSSGS